MTQRIPEGTYIGRAVAGSEQYGNTNSGNDQIVFDVELTDIGEKVAIFLVFTDKSAPYCIQKLRACGWTGDELQDLSGLDANEIQVSVRYETYEGKERMKTDIATGASPILKNPMDAKSKKAFGAKYKSLVSATKAPTAAQPKKNGGVTF